MSPAWRGGFERGNDPSVRDSRRAASRAAWSETAVYSERRGRRARRARDRWRGNRGRQKMECVVAIWPSSFCKT